MKRPCLSRRLWTSMNAAERHHGGRSLRHAIFMIQISRLQAVVEPDQVPEPGPVMLNPPLTNRRHARRMGNLERLGAQPRRSCSARCRPAGAPARPIPLVRSPRSSRRFFGRGPISGSRRGVMGFSGQEVASDLTRDPELVQKIISFMRELDGADEASFYRIAPRWQAKGPVVAWVTDPACPTPANLAASETVLMSPKDLLAEYHDPSDQRCAV